MENIALNVSELKKRYGQTHAVNGLSFSVKQGEIFGLLGPNGAGKTTTLECIEGLRKPDSGDISIMGIDPCLHQRKLWQTLGVQLQTSALPASMTPKEAVIFFSNYHGIKPNLELLERTGLSGKMNDQYGNLSTGQKRRLSLALATAHSPEIVFLDEPTAGLDVESRTELHALMRRIREEGRTIILATHDMAEAEKLCDTIAIIISGKLAVKGSPTQITSAGDKRTRITVSTLSGSVIKGRPELPMASLYDIKDGYAYYNSEHPGTTLASLLAYLSDNRDEIEDLRVERPSLEERFMEITTNGRKKQ